VSPVPSVAVFEIFLRPFGNCSRGTEPAPETRELYEELRRGEQGAG
jgi:hypothetical protein